MTELTWSGKYRDGQKVAPVRIALPFQTIETVNESAADRDKRLGSLFSDKPDTGAWTNRLIWGDKKYVLPSLLPEFAGKVDLIYIDPPFNVGADFSFTATIPDNPDTVEDETTSFVKQPSIIEQKAYRDTWGRGMDSYLQWFYETAILLRELLSEKGSIYVHLDWHVAHYAKALLDEVFGMDNFRNEIIWKRKGGSANPSNRLGIVTDSIFWYSKSEEIVFEPQFTLQGNDVETYIKERFTNDDGDGRKYMKSPIVSPNPRPNLTYPYKGYTPPKNGWSIGLEVMERWDKEGRLYFPPKGTGDRIYRKIFHDEYIGQPIQNLWTDIFVINPVANERLNYDTQKPESLLTRILTCSSKEGDLVLDCFCGSGTTAAVAEKLNRRWITCDLGRFAIHTARKRLLGIEGVKPFHVQNLGKYERQQWVKEEFAEPEDRLAQEQAYRHFIMNLYHAQPLLGHTWLHGAKAGRLVHIGSVEAPVSVEDVKQMVQELWRITGKEKKAAKAAIDVLGWEFSFDLNETAALSAAENKVDLHFYKIPREVLEKKAVEQGDIKFYELAFVELESKVKGRDVALSLKDFIISPDDVPEEVRGKITHWSQWIDYWAVDWDNKDDSFHNTWQSYRTRKDPKLELKATHTYEEKGEYAILVKVIDILGNDTTKRVVVKVS